MFPKPKSKQLLSFANAARVAAHRAEQHVQDDKDNASTREDFPGHLARGLRRTPEQCRRHEPVFNILFSFENGAGEIYTCSKCGHTWEAKEPWREAKDD